MNLDKTIVALTALGLAFIGGMVLQEERNRENHDLLYSELGEEIDKSESYFQQLQEANAHLASDGWIKLGSRAPDAGTNRPPAVTGLRIDAMNYTNHSGVTIWLWPDGSSHVMPPEASGKAVAK